MKTDNGVDKLIEDFYEEFYYRFPEEAAERGIHRYGYKLVSLRRFEISQWKMFLQEISKEISKIKSKKGFERDSELLTLEKIVKNENNWINNDQEYMINPLLYVSKIFSDLVYPAFGSYAPISIRSRNFVDKLSDLDKVITAAEENLINSHSIQKKLSIDYIDYLSAFINEFSNFLLGKSDTEKKDDIRSMKLSSTEGLIKLKNIISKLPEEETLWKIEQAFKRRYLGDTPPVDIKPYLDESLNALKDKIIKKAREIKIYAPYLETLSNVINGASEVSESKVQEVFSIIKNKGQSIFGYTKIAIDIRRLPVEIEKITTGIWNYKRFQMLPSGEFDIKPISTILLTSQENLNSIIYNVTNYIYPGLAYLKEVKSRSVKNIRKNFINYDFEQGWKIYSSREINIELKKIFGNEYELFALYREYSATLKAYFENEILMNRVSFENLKSAISRDEILLDKGAFLKELAEDKSKSFSEFLGLNFILEEKRFFTKKYKNIEFHEKLLSIASIFPFKYVRKML